jgi:hypothetical protein
VLSKAKSTLGLVDDGLAGAAVGVLVLGATELVTDGLGGVLLGVGLGLAGNLVAGAGDLLLGLVDGRLGRVGSQLLAGLGVEILAHSLRHVDGWVGVEFG